MPMTVAAGTQGGRAVRVAKAWRVRCEWADDSDIVHAENAGKARYALKLALGDCYPDLRFDQIEVRRAREHDRHLPAPHRLAAALDAEDRDIVLHAHGARRWRDAGYRNHYCTAPGNTRLLRLAWELGLFHGPYGEKAYGQTPDWAGAFFLLTDLGRAVALSMMPTYPGGSA